MPAEVPPSPILEAFGSYESRAFMRGPGYPFFGDPDHISDPAYVISARCSAGCHQHAILLDANYLDAAEFASAEMWLRRGFERTHAR